MDRMCRAPASIASRCSFLVLLAVGAAPAWAGPAATTRVTVTVDVDARTLSGKARYTLVNRAADPLAEVYLWLYPNRMAGKPRGLTDVNYYWVYPRKFNPGRMRIRAAAAARAEPHAWAG